MESDHPESERRERAGLRIFLLAYAVMIGVVGVPMLLVGIWLAICLPTVFWLGGTVLAVSIYALVVVAGMVKARRALTTSDADAQRLLKFSLLEVPGRFFTMVRSGAFGPRQWDETEAALDAALFDAEAEGDGSTSTRSPHADESSRSF